MQKSDMELLTPVRVINTGKRDPKIDFAKIIHKIRANWFYCIISACIMAGLTFLYFYVTPSTYKAVATVLIKDNNGQNSSPQNSGIASLQSLGLFPGASNVDNEKEIIVSYPILYQVAKDLKLYLDFSTYNNFKTKHLYKSTLPFNVAVASFNTTNLNEAQLSYEIELDPKTGISIMSNNKSWRGKWGEEIKLPFGNIAFSKNNILTSWDYSQSIKMQVNNISAIADDLQKNINADVFSKQTSIIDLALKTQIPEQGIDIMNRLIDVYQLSNIEDNNRITDSTIMFINNRLDLVGTELDSIEANIQHFKQTNDLADLTTQSQALITNAGSNAKDLAAQQVQLSIANSLIEYMQQNKGNDRVVPASLTINDPSVSSVIDNYNKLLLQKERLLLSATNNHPVVQNIDNQISGLKGDMLAGLTSIKNSLEAGIATMQQNEGALNDKIRQVPAKERTFVEYSRQQSIKQELFLFLLQKREESLIAKSSTVSNARVIVPGRVQTDPIAPNKRLILAFALLLGMIIPFIISFFKEIASVKVFNKDDIQDNTNAPLLAEMIHFDQEADNGIVVSQISRTPVAEQFRMLRTDLNYLLPEKDNKVVLITSSMPGEGKSYVSLNLSAMTAFSGKRVVLIEFDLRKPKLSERLGMRQDKGFSQFAIGEANLQEIIYPVADYPNLFIIPSGPVPPNPTELILLDRTKDMFKALKRDFDYIFIDTTPCIVTDARLLARYSDLTLFLIRVGVTYKEQLQQVQEFYEQEKFPHLHLIVNDVHNKRRGGAYYYGYGHGLTNLALNYDNHGFSLGKRRKKRPGLSNGYGYFES